MHHEFELTCTRTGKVIKLSSGDASRIARACKHYGGGTTINLGIKIEKLYEQNQKAFYLWKSQQPLTKEEHLRNQKFEEAKAWIQSEEGTKAMREAREQAQKAIDKLNNPGPSISDLLRKRCP